MSDSEHERNNATEQTAPQLEVSIPLVAHLVNWGLKTGKIRPELLGAWALETAAGLARSLGVRERAFVQMARKAYCGAARAARAPAPQQPAAPPDRDGSEQ